EVSALAAENGNDGNDQTVVSVYAPGARIHDVTLVSHDKRNWGYAEPGPNFGNPKDPVNNQNLTAKVVDSGALFVETAGRADLWFYDSAVHAAGPGVLTGTLQTASTSRNPAPCAPSSDGVRVENVRFTGYYAGEPDNLPNSEGSGRAVGVVIYNGKKLAVRNCHFESAARTSRKIMCRTVLALNTSTQDLYLAGNRSLNVGSHSSATGMDGNQGEQYLFHYRYPYGGLFDVAQAGPDSVTLDPSGVPPIPGQPDDPHYNDPHYFTDNAGSRVLPEVGTNDHWLVFICAGKGVGQYRRVTAQSAGSGLIKLTVDRPWRVAPDTTSRFNLTPAYRRIVLYKNYVDTGGSTNLRKTHKSHGVLFWCYAFDNVVEGNTFKAMTSGILFNSRFRAPTAWNLTRGNTVSDVMGTGGDTSVKPTGYVDHFRVTQAWPAPADRVFYSVGNAARENHFDIGNGESQQYYGAGAYLHARFTGNVPGGLPPVEHATGGIVMSVIENNIFTGLLEEGVVVEAPANTCLVRRNQIKLPASTPAEKTVVVEQSVRDLNLVMENNEAVPEITRSPLSQSAPLGTRIKLTVSAAGGDNFQYQWMKDGAILDGATSASLLLEGTPADAGSYRCLVTGAGAGVWSEPAEITISPAPGGPLSAPVAVAVDASGALYIADAARHDIQSVGAANTLALLAGVSGSAGLADGAGAGAMFDTPSALAVRSGTLFVSDAENARVRTVSAAGRVGSLAASGFVTPAGIAADDRGNLYVADKGAHVIRKLDGATGAPAIVAGQTGAPGFANGAGMLARFAAPEGVAWKPSGSGAGVLYVADTENHVVREIDLDAGAEVSTLAGVAGDAGCADGQGAGARFNLPGGIIVDGAGTLFLADTGNSVIREISPSGMVLTLAGNPGADGIAGIPGFKDGAGLGALFNRPSALALSPDGEFLYVADTGNRAIRKIDANDNVSTLALVAAPDATPPGADGGTGGNGGGGAFSRWFLAVLFFSMMLRHALNKQTPI
ncbi:MAG: immunoglobulin domain-containing protein, partial [Opitutaceae bacterium]|nr:immunoglobulin domain-containing protein [Opitutaceae bacterium]